MGGDSGSIIKQKQGSKESKWVQVWRKTHQSLGFSKGYNLPLFVIFAGAMLGFSLARLSYLNIAGSNSHSFANGASPGEWYWYRQGHYRVGITIHLGTILPAGLLIICQFVPIIRYKFLLFHRINGYIIILLVNVSNAGILMIARRAFGGGVETQTATGLLVIVTELCLALAWYNIKRLQIDQHRKWMLRAMFALGTIITLRIIMIISALIISMIGNYSTVKPCDEIAFIRKDDNINIGDLYPGCINASSHQSVVTPASFNGGNAEQIGSSLDMTFGMAMWLSIFLHLVGVEIYLALTPRENERLRRVSYERQMERGFKNPGSAGLTADRFGDADKWTPRDVGN